DTLLISPSSWSSLLPFITSADNVKIAHRGSLFEHVIVENGSPPIRFFIDVWDEKHCRITIKGFERMTLLQGYQSLLYKGTIFQLDRQ
ncbi:hypothetical protein R0J91_17680, partial [Micrococcus sp. SIMBA_131]